MRLGFQSTWDQAPKANYDDHSWGGGDPSTTSEAVSSESHPSHPKYQNNHNTNNNNTTNNNTTNNHNTTTHNHHPQPPPTTTTTTHNNHHNHTTQMANTHPHLNTHKPTIETSAHERTPLITTPPGGDRGATDLESNQLTTTVRSDPSLFAHHIPNNFHPPSPSISPSGASKIFFRGPHSPSDLQSLKNFLASSYLNLLLAAVPLSFASHFLRWGSNADFIISFIAIIPLAGLLGDATEQVALKVGSTLGGLLNATFGNAVEAIVGIVALSQNQLRIVQTSMLGSILSNILLVLGCSFIAAGCKFKESKFQATAAQASASLMLLSCIALVIPAAYFTTFLEKLNWNRPGHGSLAHAGAALIDPQHLTNTLRLPHESSSQLPGLEKAQHGLLVISRGTSVLLLAMYILYLYFQLSSHSYLYEDESSEAEEEEPKMNLRSATAALVAVTLVTAFCADYLVDSIDEFANQAGIPKTFIGLILLPIVGNAAEHVTAVFMAMKGKMELAIGVAVGSSIQIAVGVIPIMVIVGWATGKELTLFFENFETICFVFSVLLTTLLIQDGKSNYMEGAMLVSLYVIIGLAFWVS